MDRQIQGARNTQTRFVGIAQGSAGILEAGTFGLGLYTDKLQPCQAYVFVCEMATIMIHDTGQIRLEAIVSLLRQYGAVNVVHFGFGYRESDNLHAERLVALGEALQFDQQAWRPVRVPKDAPFNVAFSSEQGLQVVSAYTDNVVKDPNHNVRERINKLNDIFTPSNSQTAPLDVQYLKEAFAPVPPRVMAWKEMLTMTLADAEINVDHALIDIRALYELISKTDLPEAFKDFVRENELEKFSVAPVRLPAWSEDARRRDLCIAAFKKLPIFQA
jgi:hypothetical protein